MWGNDGPNGWEWIWMTLMMAFFWVPLLLALVWLLRSSGGSPFGDRERQSPDASAGEADAREVARRAYARGELERERFLEIIEDLEKTSPTAS